MTDQSRQSAQLVASWAQFVAICVGIGTILLYIGRKDQQLEERLKELASRIDRIERGRS